MVTLRPNRQRTVVAPKVIFLPEPDLRFGHEQNTPHPKDGLLLFGPETNPFQSGALQFGVVGTADGLARLQRWIRQIQAPVMPKEAANPNHTVFPGFEAVYEASLPDKPRTFAELKPDEIKAA